MRENTLEEQAEVVWRAASKGRANARNGFRSSAIAFMEALRAVRTGNPHLVTIAQSAANDIHLLLIGAVGPVHWPTPSGAA